MEPSQIVMIIKLSILAIIGIVLIQLIRLSYLFGKWLINRNKEIKPDSIGKKIIVHPLIILFNILSIIAIILLALLLAFAATYVVIDRYIRETSGPIVDEILKTQSFQIIKDTGLVDLMDVLIYQLPKTPSPDERIKLVSMAIGKYLSDTVNFAAETVPIETSKPSERFIDSTYEECLKDQLYELTPEMSSMERAQAIVHNSKIRTQCKSLKLRQNK